MCYLCVCLLGFENNIAIDPGNFTWEQVTTIRVPNKLVGMFVVIEKTINNLT